MKNLADMLNGQPDKPKAIHALRSFETIKLFTVHSIGPLNPFKPNGVSRPYPLDQSISVLRVVGWYFSFYSQFNRILCK